MLIDTVALQIYCLILPLQMANTQHTPQIHKDSKLIQ